MFDLDNFSNVAITNGLLQILYVNKFDETNFASKRYVLREFNINDSWFLIVVDWVTLEIKFGFYLKIYACSL